MGSYETRQTIGLFRMVGLALILATAATGCATAPNPPSYTQAQLKTACERHGGWWRANLLLSDGGLCENQATGVENGRR